MITTYNDVEFLAAAIASALDQECPPAEVVVVDDGSAVDVGPVVDAFAGVRLIRQANAGLSAARNTGLAAISAEFVSFLDADDLLLPNALRMGVECLEARPDAAFAYGAYRHIDRDGGAQGPPYHFTPLVGDAFLGFLRGNLVSMHATVLYRRALLVEAGGFEVGWRKCEDYDLYLRLARNHAVVCHPELVALYRRHNANMSLDHLGMMRAACAVLEAQRGVARGIPGGPAALAEGLAGWKSYYIEEAVNALIGARRHRPLLEILWRTAAVAMAAPVTFASVVAAAYRRRRARRLSPEVPE